MSIPALLRVGVAVLLLPPTTPSWAAEADSAGLTPDRAVAAAIAFHPDLRVVEARVTAARGSRAQYGLFLENPRFNGSSLVGSTTELELVQPVSVLGEGRHARRSATAWLSAAQAQRDRGRLTLAAAVRQAWADAAATGAIAQIADEGLSLAEQLRDAATRKHAEGEASLLEVRLARLAEIQAAASLLEAQRDRGHALTALSALVGRAVDGLDVDSNPLVAAPVGRTIAARERSDLAAARAGVDRRAAALARQRAAALPSIGVGVAVELLPGQAHVGAAFALELPLFDRNQQGRALALGALDVARAAVTSLEARVAAEQSQAEQRVAQAEQVAELLAADPIADARAALAALAEGYSAGELDLSTTLLLQRQVLEGERAAVQLARGVAEARLDAMLAFEDAALIPGGEG